MSGWLIEHFHEKREREREKRMGNKKLTASFKCVLAVLSCLTLGACKPQMAKKAISAAGKVFSKGGSKAERFAERAARNGVHMPHISGGEMGGAGNLMQRQVAPGQYNNWGGAGRAAAYHFSRQRPCGTCGGRGQVYQSAGYDDYGNPVGYWMPCPSCRR